MSRPNSIYGVGTSSWFNRSSQTIPTLVHFLDILGGSFAFDPADGYALAFGGGAPPSFSETGTWGLSGVNWTNLSVAAGPPHRLFASMAWDYSDDSMVLFGGLWLSATTGFSLYGDTWTYRAGSWQQVSTSVQPAARYGAAMAYDPATESVILFGGTNGTAAYNDSWSFKAGAWTNVTAAGSSPSARFLPGMAWDSGSQSLILFGGGTPTVGGNLTEWNDTWSYAAGSWSQVRPSSGAPPARLGNVLANDTAQSDLVLAGGMANNVALNDTWRFSSGLWTHVTGAAAPPGDYGVATYDTETGRVLLKSASATLAPTLLGDGTWSFNGTVWRLQVRIGVPGPLLAPSLAADPALGGVVLFGGANGTGGSQDATWLYKGGVWAEIGIHDGPAAREGASMAFDDQMGGLVLFGGADASSIFNDTWLYSSGGWHHLPELAAPLPGVYVALAYDPASRSLVAFGGNNNTTTFGSTWVLQSGGSWVDTGSLGPAPRTDCGFTVNPDGIGLVLFGGSTGPSSNGTETYLSDTWNWSYSTWTSDPSAAPPPGRTGAGFAYDPHFGADFLFGGSNLTTVFSDTWEFRLGSWANVTLGPSPGALTDASLAYDPGVGTVVEFGGVGIQANPPAVLLYGTTWELDPLEAIASSSADSGTAPIAINFSASAVGGVAPLSPFWQFADGGSVSTWNVTHAYYQPYDEYKATFTVTDFYGATLSIGFTLNITGAGVPPLAALVSASPMTGAAPLLVNFTGTPSGGVGNYSFAWTFGDGGLSTILNPSHTYVTPGTYTAVLEVTDSLGGTAGASVAITILPTVIQPLAVSLLASPGNGPAPLTVNLSATASGGVAPYEFAWAYGDGTSGAGPSVRHTFVGPGNYTVTVTGTDNDSTRVSSSTVIRVSVASNTTPGPGTPKGSNGSASGLPTWAIPAILLLAVAVISGVAVVLAVRRRRRASRARDAEPVPAWDEGPGPPPPG